MHSVSLSQIPPARSGRVTIIVVQHSIQPPAALDRSGVDARAFRHNQPIAQTLVVPFVMIVLQKFVDRLPVRSNNSSGHAIAGCSTFDEIPASASLTSA
jgi:hypothetical protein